MVWPSPLWVQGAEPGWGAALAVGPVNFLLWGGRCDLFKGAETGRGKARIEVPSV